MADSALQFLNDYDEGSADEQTLVVPEQPVTQAQPVEADNALEFLSKQDATMDVKTEVESLAKEEPEEVPTGSV